MTEWISVKDRLPELPTKSKYASVMVIASYGEYVSPMIYERSFVRGKVVERWKYYWDRIADKQITHWMPLPEPPKEDNHE